MGIAKRTCRVLAALTLTAGAGAGAAGAAGMFGAEPLSEGSTVAVAQPVDGNRWTVAVLERLQPGTACWQRQPDGLVRLDPQTLGDPSLCTRLQSSGGYSLRAADQDLDSPWRLRVEAVGNRLELQAFNPILNSPLTIATAPLAAAAADGLVLPPFSLLPGWSFQKRSFEGRLLSHVYLSSRDSLAVLQSRGRGAVPAPLPSLGSDRDPDPTQVIALQVVPFRDDAGLPAAGR